MRRTRNGYYPFTAMTWGYDVMIQMLDKEMPLWESSALLPVFTDYRALCAPHVKAVRDVLQGCRYRYKVQFNETTFHFFHGCLMAYVVTDGVIRALPPFGLGRDGVPYLQALPEHQLKWLEEFMSLPKSTLLYYFSLLKEVFKGYAIRYRWQDPETGKTESIEMPEALKSILAEVEWYAL